MRVKEWAELEGVTPQTVQRWCNNNKMPVPYEKVGRIYLIHDPKYEDINKASEDINESNVVCYSRVSSGDQKEDLIRQQDRIKAFAVNLGYNNPVSINEIASGMNENRSKLNDILLNQNYKLIIVEHRERLARINFKLIQSALRSQGRDIIVVDDSEIEDDLVRDITEIMTSFCARLYGRRGAKNRAKRAMKAAEEE